MDTETPETTETETLEETDEFETEFVPTEVAEFEDSEDEMEEEDEIAETLSGEDTSILESTDMESSIQAETIETNLVAGDSDTSNPIETEAKTENIAATDTKQQNINLSAVPHQSKKEAVPVDDSGTTLLIRETISKHQQLMQRVRDLERVNINNDQIVLFFVGTADKNGRSWHADSNQVEKALNYMVKKLKIGGFLLKIHVGYRNEWLNPDNPFRKDPKLQIINIPTVWVWGTAKRIFGRRCFDLESLYLILKD